MRFFTHFFVQDDQSVKLLKEAGFLNVTLSGDTRFDRVYQLSKNSRDYLGIELFKQNKSVMIAGSTWEKDDEIIIRFINQCSEDYKFILAPHEINKKKIYSLLSQIEGSVVRFTDADTSFFPKAKVMIIDTIGHLSSVYKYGDVAYIGGGFGKGIHNILEAATYGLPVIFGPNYMKFREAKDLLKLGGAFSIENYEEFFKISEKLFSVESFQAKTSQIAKSYVEKKVGATDKVLNLTM